MAITRITRRDMAKQTMLAAQSVWPVWMPRLAFSQQGAPKGDVLVCIFLRGGADGLNIVAPFGDSTYYTLRPTINLARPDDTRTIKDSRALNLDGFFGLHPTLAPLLPIFQAGRLTAVHAVGSPDPTRSHFDAMDYMERGTPGDSTTGSGWLGRHLLSLNTGNTSPFRGVSWGDGIQDSLRGAINVTSLSSIIDYHLQGNRDAEMLTALNALYAADTSSLQALAQQTQAAVNIVSKLDVAHYQPAGGAQYVADDGFSLALMQTAALIKADVGLEVAAVDLGGWDTHENELPDLAAALTVLGKGLAAFHADLGDRLNTVTVVVMSEFGRRAEENASKGTDHGHGNMMLVMGSNVAAKPVVAQWPGLGTDQLDDGDLSITTDYRDVLAEIISLRLQNPHLDTVFPRFKPTLRGVVRA